MEGKSPIIFRLFTLELGVRGIVSAERVELIMFGCTYYVMGYVQNLSFGLVATT